MLGLWTVQINWWLKKDIPRERKILNKMHVFYRYLMKINQNSSIQIWQILPLYYTLISHYPRLPNISNPLLSHSFSALEVKRIPHTQNSIFFNGWKIPFTTITSFKATIRDLRGIWPHNRVIHNRDPSWPIRTTPYSDDEVFAQSDDHLCNTRAPRNRAFTSQESKSKRCCECEIAKHINGHYIPITRGCRRSPVESGCRIAESLHHTARERVHRPRLTKPSANASCDESPSRKAPTGWPLESP